MRPYKDDVWLAGVIDDAGIGGGTLVVKGSIGQFVEVINRSPTEEKFGFGVV